MRARVTAQPERMGSARGTVGDESAQIAQAKHNRAAFGPLYDRYLPDVYGYCLAQLGGREAAEDTSQIVFAKALGRIGTFDDRAGTGSFRSWLFAIAHNAIVDALRARHPQQPLEEAWEIEDRAPSPEAVAIARDERRDLHALLARLSPQQRAVVELRLSHLTDREIADVLGIAPNAVRQAQHRALVRLRDLLNAAPSVTGHYHANPR